jgi:glutamate 5-kinase
VDGLLDKNDRLVPVVTDIAKAKSLARVEKGKFSVGGMVSKLQAVKVAVDAGVQSAIANGRKPGQIAALVEGRAAGTLFPSAPI